MNIIKKNPSDVDFLEKPTQKKLKNIFLADCHTMNERPNKAARVLSCGTYLEFTVSEKSKKLTSANFCKARLCPMCNWRLSQKRFSNLSAVTELAKSNKYQLLFLTLTAKNVKSTELKAEIRKFFDSWKNLTKDCSKFKKSVHGWFRALEVTYNKDTDTYHPHLHIILAVKSTYFNANYYINQEEWTNIWKNYLKIDYSPVVHIQKAYIKKGKNSSSAEVEASKYTVKDSDYLIENNLVLSAQIVDVLDSALKRVRIIAFGGVLKKYYQELQLSEENYNDEKIAEDIESVVLKYRWNFGMSKYLPI